MNGILKSLIVSLILIGGMGTAEAATALTVPAADTNITTGFATYSVTVTTAVTNGTNVSVWYNTSATAWARLCSNGSALLELTTYTWACDMSALADGSYNFKAVVNDSLSGEENSSAVGNMKIGIDDTGPTISGTALVDATVSSAATVTWTCLDADFSNEACDNCTYYQKADSSNLGDCLEGTGCAMTGSGTTFTYSYTPTVYGIKASYAECFDQHGQSTNTSDSNIQVHSRGSGLPPGYGPQEVAKSQDAAQKASDRNRNILLIAIGLIAVAALLLVKK